MNLFLDDFRLPIECATYMWMRQADCRIYHEKWNIIRSYGDFVRFITNNGLPNRISFDYDLSDVPELKMTLPYEDWYNIDDDRVYTGDDCAKWLINYCEVNNKKLPECIVHSSNPDGVELIKKTLSL